MDVLPEQNNLLIKYNENYNVTQANELIRSRQDNLSLLETKLIRLAIAQVLKADKDLQTYRCDVVKLAEFLGISRQNIYDEFQNMSDSLLRKLIYIKAKDGTRSYKKYQWVVLAEYHEKEGYIIIKLNEELKPYLIGLNELFTSYSYEEILRLPTNYSIRLYELLYSYCNLRFQKNHHATIFNNAQIGKDEIIFTIEQLREYFNCERKYTNSGDFVKRVIKPSVEDINSNTVYPCSYRLIKEKNRITNIVFKLN